MAAHLVCGHRRYERPWRSISRLIWLSEIGAEAEVMCRAANDPDHIS
jgi:hypothetical protein